MNEFDPANDNNQVIYMRAIQIWVAGRQLNNAMEREELAKLEGIQRHIAVSKGLLPNMIRVCRMNPRVDCKLAVLAIIHLLSDNNDGLCRLSIARFAQLLSRKEDNVRAAIDALEDEGIDVIGVIRSRAGNSYWPKIDAELAHMSPSMGWFVDALSIKPKSAGRPLGSRKNYPQSTGDSYFGESVSTEKLSPVDGKTTPQSWGTYITNVNRYELDGSYKRGQNANGQARARGGRP
jgi:hypothetical protein